MRIELEWMAIAKGWWGIDQVQAWEANWMKIEREWVAIEKRPMARLVILLVLAHSGIQEALELVFVGLVVKFHS